MTKNERNLRKILRTRGKLVCLNFDAYVTALVCAVRITFTVKPAIAKIVKGY